MRRFANGEEDRNRAQFTPWFWSGRLQAKIEAALVIAVFAGVLAIMVILVQMPGALVVHVRDDKLEPIKGARVTCRSPDGATSYAGMTDVFGEAKWPGLTKGPWTCEVTPPDRYHGGQELGIATVVSRYPAMWTATFERPGRINVQVTRPPGAPRAAVAVRALCGDESWEARAGLLDGRALLFVPHGKECRIGMARPELPASQPGPLPKPELDCTAQPCRGGISAGVGEEVSVALSPTPQQWEAARPPPEPDPAEEKQGQGQR